MAILEHSCRSVVSSLIIPNRQPIVQEVVRLSSAVRNRGSVVLLKFRGVSWWSDNMPSGGRSESEFPVCLHPLMNWLSTLKCYATSQRQGAPQSTAPSLPLVFVIPTIIRNRKSHPSGGEFSLTLKVRVVHFPFPFANSYPPFRPS